MKVTMLFIVAMIVAIISPTLGQTKVQKETKETFGARIHNQSDFNALTIKLAKMDDSQAVTVEMLREALSYFHDLILKDGHKEYVSMPGLFKKQIVAKFSNEVGMVATKADAATKAMNTLEAKVDAATKTVSTLEASVDEIAYFTRGLDESIANIELVMTGDKTPIVSPESLTGFDGTKTMVPACDEAMQQIKKSVAARRAEAIKIEKFVQ